MQRRRKPGEIQKAEVKEMYAEKLERKQHNKHASGIDEGRKRGCVCVRA